MTAIDIKKSDDRDADKGAGSERPECDERRRGEPTESDEAGRREDPFGLDPLGPPSGRPW